MYILSNATIYNKNFVIFHIFENYAWLVSIEANNFSNIELNDLYLMESYITTKIYCYTQLVSIFIFMIHNYLWNSLLLIKWLINNSIIIKIPFLDYHIYHSKSNKCVVFSIFLCWKRLMSGDKRYSRVETYATWNIPLDRGPSRFPHTWLNPAS